MGRKIISQFTPDPAWRGLVALSKQKPSAVLSELEAVLRTWRETIQSIERSTELPTWENTVEPFHRLELQLSTFWNRCNHFFHVENSSAWERIITTGERRITAMETREMQSSALLARRKQLRRDRRLSPAQRRSLDLLIQRQRRSGAGLPLKTKRSLQRSFTTIARLGSRFGQLLLQATNSIHIDVQDTHELDGIPVSIVKQARMRAKQAGISGWRFTIRRSEAGVVLRTATSRAMRERLYRASVSLGGESAPPRYQTSSVMYALLQERQVMARLLGFSTYAKFKIAERMARTPQKAEALIRSIATTARPIAGREFQRLAQFARRELNLDAVAPWDVDFVAEKYRERYLAASSESLRPHFPLQAVMAGIAATAQRVFGVQIRFTPWRDGYRSGLWIARVEDEDGCRGEILFDLHTRPEKRGGAWMNSDANPVIQDGRHIPARAYVVCNFPLAHGQHDTLLDQTEVTTLFHECGHALHLLLSDSRVSGVEGMNGVEWDVIELPSQFFEQFAWETSVWDAIARAGAPRLPEKIRKNLRASRSFLGGLRVLRQTQFALYDLALYANPKPRRGMTTSLWLQILKTWGVLPWTKDNRFPNSFSHIFDGGYSAGYYSYLWAEVLVADVFTPFSNAPARWSRLGAAYRREILSVGGSRSGADSFRQLKGRSARTQPLFKLYGLSRG